MLTKLSKEKGCEVIGKWKKACVRHFYWAVTSTTPKLSQVILAKFDAFQSHITNVHTKLSNRLSDKCAHGDITKPRVWMSKCIYKIIFFYINQINKKQCLLGPLQLQCRFKQSLFACGCSPLCFRDSTQEKGNGQCLPTRVKSPSFLSVK